MEHGSRIRPDPDPRLSRSMEYGLAILECFSSESPALGIADIAGIVGISRSTAHRYTTTLVALGYLNQYFKRKYRLSRRAAGPGVAAIGAIRLSASERARLEELRDQTGHTVSVGVLDLPSPPIAPHRGGPLMAPGRQAPDRLRAGGVRVIYVERIPAHGAGQHEVDLVLGIGTAIPAHRTALGKALMAGLPDAERLTLLEEIKLERVGPNSITQGHVLDAELDRIRRDGLSLSDEELVPGLRSLATLVGGERHPRPISVEVGAPAGAYTARELVTAVGPPLRRAAELLR